MSYGHDTQPQVRLQIQQDLGRHGKRQWPAKGLCRLAQRPGLTIELQHSARLAPPKMGCTCCCRQPESEGHSSRYNCITRPQGRPSSHDPSPGEQKSQQQCTQHPAAPQRVLNRRSTPRKQCHKTTCSGRQTECLPAPKTTPCSFGRTVASGQTMLVATESVMSAPNQTRLNTSVPLVPPKPKLFLTATSIFMSRAVLAQ